MSLPQTATMKPTQSSIKSFFQPRQQPSYAPPPPSSKYAPAPPTTGAATATAPPPAAKPPTSTTITPPPSTTTASPPPPVTTPPTPAASMPIHPSAGIRPVDDHDLQPLRRINSLLLPVAYPETFYAAALTGPLSRVITWSDPSSPGVEQVVGGVVSRIEPSPFPPASPGARPEHALYIQSLALLSPYRSYGLATAVIDHLVAAAAALSPEINLRHIYAHVWTDNEEGMHWYTARGFERYGEPLQGYYIKLRPDSAWIVRRTVGPLSVGAGSRHTEKTAAPVPGPTAAVANLPPMSGGPPRAAADESLSRTPSGQSFQNRRAATEWNDLPEDMASSMLAPPRNSGGSGASSRSSSSVRKKRDRSYPAAAFQG
ncbi:N-acetyl transferase separation anxiety [Colletotrichum higginsianum]|uniref:N-acetyl transferase separation anxiety n=1 Tax=Colletotrichum higginsianum (strain IMI 349063) TaxID=759273 RepID=H1V9F5_COLHI|nr:N-acetyl transferase separation anxiety [Colletotrichum higginsianum]